MADIVSPRKRSEMMAGIKGKDTKPEMAVRGFLHRNGFRYRLHKTGIPGKPDLVLAKHRACIFVHGCYWHRHPGCRLAYTPKSQVEKWNRKFSENVARDKRQRKELLETRWRVAVIWECAIRDNLDLSPLTDWLRGTDSEFEFPESAL